MGADVDHWSELSRDLPTGFVRDGVAERLAQRDVRTDGGLCVLSTNRIGLALGPTSVALASDYIFESTQAVSSSMVLVGGVLLPMSVLLMWRGLVAIKQAA